MSIKNAAGDQVRINIKNDKTYTLTAALTFGSLGQAVLQGYSNSVGDLGKTTFTSNITSGTNYTMTANSNTVFVDLIFINTGASGGNHVFVVTGLSEVMFIRCVFTGARGSGFAQNPSGIGHAYLIECEAYANNASNAANEAGFRQASNGGSVMFCYNCYSHDNAGSNSNGFSNNAASGGSMILVNCIADTNGANGASILSSARALISINSNYYNNTGDAIKLATTTTSGWTFIANNNFLKNGGKGVNNTGASTGGILYNNGRGSGSQANGSSDTLQSIVDTGTDITYASGDTPWNAPTTGDFTTIPTSAARSAGRGVFTETDGTNTGTVAYPDIGAAQALVTPELRIPSIASI